VENADAIQIRLLEESDPPSIAAAFKNNEDGVEKA